MILNLASCCAFPSSVQFQSLDHNVPTQSEDCRALKTFHTGRALGQTSPDWVSVSLMWVYQSFRDAKTPSFQLLQEVSHFTSHFILRKNINLNSSRCGFHSFFSSHSHFPSYCFIFIPVICATNWSEHESGCTIKFTHAATLLSQRRSSDARTHPVDKALRCRWIWRLWFQ